MENNQIYEAMGHLDPMLVQEAAERKSSKTLRRRPLIVAACLALAVGIPTVAAVKNFVVQYYEDDELPENLQEEFERGFIMENPYHIPAENFSEELFRHIESLGTDPTYDDRQLYFDSMEEVENFIGFNLFDNPVLDEAKPGISHRIDENGNYTQEYHCRLHLEGLLRGNPREDLGGMSVRSSCNLNGVHISMDVQISTKEGGDVMGYYHSTPTEKNADIPNYEPMEERMTASGKEYTIAYGKYPKHELWCAKVFFLNNGAGIAMDFSGYDEATLRETVQQVMDGFQ